MATAIAAIETVYKGIRFRSRLEAKWACFFDLCGWAWSYEPMDLNGWIPDFALGEHPVLVEVKPFFHREEWKDTVEKINKSGCEMPVILLGASPTHTQAGFVIEHPEIGEPHSCPPGLWSLDFGITEGNGKPGLCPMDGGWWNCIWNFGGKAGRVWGFVDIDSKSAGGDGRDLLQTLWSEACNTTRWMPKGR